jgi:catechol 2,3-dioxygenase-like lactoylglutathione lyase family enzyme
VISHISLGVRDLARSKAFYHRVLMPLGYVQVLTKDRAIGFGEPGGEDSLTLFAQPAPITIPSPGFHLAFLAPSHEAVDAFHAAAITAGGTSEGLPGPRLSYGPTYYATFVRDPDGYKLEAHYQ